MNGIYKDWYKLRTVSPSCDPTVMFGITDRSNEQDYLYPDRSPKRGSTVIWHPAKNAHISIGSYVEAMRNKDEAAIEKLQSLGIPRDINFGYGPKDDLSSTYVALKPPRQKKADSVKVMRAEYAAEFEDGSKFNAGDVVKILFRKKFVEDRGGAKRFHNAYERPTADEMADFLKGENA